jgi:hypothetical protein
VLLEEFARHGDALVGPADGLEHAGGVVIVGKVVRALLLSHEKKAAGVFDENAEGGPDHFGVGGGLGLVRRGVGAGAGVGPIVVGVFRSEEAEDFPSVGGEGGEFVPVIHHLIILGAGLGHQVAAVFSRSSTMSAGGAFGQEERFPAAEDHRGSGGKNLDHDFLLLLTAGGAGQEAGGTGLGQVAGVDDAGGKAGGGRFPHQAKTSTGGSQGDLVPVHAEGVLVDLDAVGVDGGARVGAGAEGVAQVAAIEGKGGKAVPGKEAVGTDPADAAGTPVHQASAVRMKEDDAAERGGGIGATAGKQQAGGEDGLAAGEGSHERTLGVQEGKGRASTGKAEGGKSFTAEAQSLLR